MSEQVGRKLALYGGAIVACGVAILLISGHFLFTEGLHWLINGMAFMLIVLGIVVAVRGLLVATGRYASQGAPSDRTRRALLIIGVLVGSIAAALAILPILRR